MLWARSRLRAKYHMFITAQPNFGFLPKSSIRPAVMYSDTPFLTETALVDAIRMACGIDYVLTLSSPCAGASIFGMHFQAMPARLSFNNESYHLFNWLDENVPVSTENSVVMLKAYPATCIRISGEQRYVFRNVWYLARNYNDLMSYNLIIQGIDQERAKVYFFPRPFTGNLEGPQDFNPPISKLEWAFGAFEMGGFFLIGDEIAYRSIINGGESLLKNYLRGTSISQELEEMDKLKELMIDLVNLNYS